MGPNPNYDGPWPSFLGFLYGFDTWNTTYPDMAFNTSIKWTAESPNTGWQGGSESIAINGLKNAINNDQCTLISGIAHASSSSSLDVYSSSWESDYHNTRPFFLHDYGCHCGDMSASDDGVLHSMLFHSDTELAFATIYNTGYGWGNFYCTNASSALQQKLFWDYLFNLSKCGGIESWQLGKAQAYSKDAMAPTIYYEDTFRETIQCCLLFGDPAQKLKPPVVPDREITGLNENWNFFSLPFNEQIEKTDIIIAYNNSNYSWAEATTTNNPTGSPLIDSNCFGWDKTYQVYYNADELIPGEGYWLFSQVECEIWVHNITKISSSQITNIEPTWNVIGLPDDDPILKAESLVYYNDTNYVWADALLANLLDDSVFGWNSITQQYYTADTLNPGDAYWLYAYESCEMTQDI
jgi:hypothetical protein